MPVDRIFTAGSLAKMYVEVAEWLGDHTHAMHIAREGPDNGPFSILVPFTGFSRMASAMAGLDTTIETCDFQYLSSAIVNGIFKAQKLRSNVDKPRFHKGDVYEGKLFLGTNSQPDKHSAGFIDWIIQNGTTADRAIIGMSIPGQTMRGWMNKWTGNFDGLYEKFCKVRSDCAAFVNMPGAWFHYEADFFQLAARMDPKVLKTTYDVLVVDPPRLSGPQGKDSYSRGAWDRLNKVLGGTVKVTPWSNKNYAERLQRVFDIDSNYILFTWQEGYPKTENIRERVLALGALEDERTWEGYGKTVFGWRIRRHGVRDA